LKKTTLLGIIGLLKEGNFFGGNMKISVKELNKKHAAFADKEVSVSGWAKTVRDNKSIGFLELNDGSAFKPVQVVLAED